MTAQTASLGDVAEFVNGVAFKEDDWGDQGRPIIRIQNLNDPGKPFNRTVRQVADRNLARDGDLLVSWAASLGVYEWEGEEACINQHIFKVIPDVTRVDKQYLRRALEASLGHMERETHGATMKHITRDRFLRIPIQLPSVSEQRRIAAILDKADALRAKRREAIAKLDQLLQSVFLDMFGDPVTNARGWLTVRFGDVTESRLGKMLDKKTSQGAHMKPYLANLNVQWGRFELGALRTMNFDPDDQREFSLRRGDLLMCEGGEPGRCAIWKEQIHDCYYQKALHRIRVDPTRCMPEYVQWLFWFLAQAGAFRGSVASATIAHLPGVKLKKLEIPLPPVGLQRRFAEMVNVIEARAVEQSKSASALDRAFTALQHQAFSGAI